MQLLALFAEPSFVIPWYVFGLIAGAWVAMDLRRVNTPLKTAMKWAWPIIVLFFSVIGLALYFLTARAPGIAQAHDAESKHRLHDDYERSMLRRVNGAVIHCVAGDGLGIMTAMVIARAAGFTFWQEFWFEYAVGFAFGWFIFQYKSMRMMSDGPGAALWMAFRAEFFSMLTVMGGMGAVMTFVTPMVVGAQPGPLTVAFWGFGALGLLAGYVLTFPMNWMLVKVGWKHGMGSKEGAQPVHEPRGRAGLFAAMSAAGVAALALTAWLTVVRESYSFVPLPDDFAAAALGPHAGPSLLEQGLGASLQTAARALEAGQRREASAALDSALRAAEVMRVAADLPSGGQARPDSAASAAAPVDGVRAARRELQNGNPEAAAAIARVVLGQLAQGRLPHRPPGDLADYAGVMAINAEGALLGKVRAVKADRVELAMGAGHDVFGFLDVRPGRTAWVPAREMAYGPRRTLGKSYAMVLTLDMPPRALATARR